MRACAEPRPGHPESWINDPILGLYGELFARGHAHSVECRRDGELVGGLYGISLGKVFFGESMFSRETDASKVALARLVERLRAQDCRLIDCQQATAHLASLGAREISRREFAMRVQESIQYPPTGTRWT
jgi:leucyl/phenylalanyl-tRNA--protein transferase